MVALSPTDHVRGIALLAAAVLGFMPILEGGWGLLFGGLLVILMARVVFGLTLTVTNETVTIRRLLKTIRIPASDIAAVHFVAPIKLDVGKRSMPESGSLTIYRTNYEPFVLPMHENMANNPDKFATAANRLLQLDESKFESDHFDIAKSMKLSMQFKQSEQAQIGFSGLAVVAVAAMAGASELGDLSTRSLWVLPLCLAGLVCGFWLAINRWKAHERDGGWEGNDMQTRVIAAVAKSDSKRSSFKRWFKAL